jgi:hypothetical protein
LGRAKKGNGGRRVIDCRNCIHWIDESLAEIEADPNRVGRLYTGCRIFGHVENSTSLESCERYVQSENLYAICSRCKITVPKVCLSLGECANCTDTDLFCVDRCLGGDSRKYCTHFIRLRTEGVHLIVDDRLFELFPTLAMPGRQDACPPIEPEEGPQREK